MKRRKKKSQPPVEGSVFYESILLEAMEGKITGSLAFFERKVRRWFSQKFSTPLLDVYKIPWEFVLLNYYEDRIDKWGFNDLFDKLVQEHLPEFKKQAEEEDKAFADSLLEEQKATMAKKAKKDEEYRKKIEQAGEIIEGLHKNSEVLDKVRQSLGNKPLPIQKNIKFEDENDPEGS